MNNMREKISQILKKSNLKELDSRSREEIIEQINIYHEELLFQNEELKELNEKLEETLESFKALFSYAPIPFVIVNEEGHLLRWNDSYLNTFSNAKKVMDIRVTIEEKSQDDFYYFFRDLKNNVDNQLSSTKNIGFYSDNEIKYFKINGTAISEKGKRHYLICYTEVTNEHNYLQKIEELSFKDHLTGLYNRRFFEAEISRIDVERNLPIGFIMGDVNGLKVTNDAFGHLVGDKLLILIADLLRKLCREDELIARLGGDEFGIVFPKISEAEMKSIYKRILNSCSNITFMGFTVSFSVGYALKTDNTQDTEEVMGIAEEMMYKNKMFSHESHQKQVIDSILSSLHVKHPREELHSKRVSDLMVDMARHLNYDESTVLKYKVMGLFHDLGKIAIDYSILDKKEPLTKEDFIEIRRHPEIGYRILKSTGVFSEIMEGVLHHHERVDGQGYPSGLKGNELSEETKILTICDAYDAMTSNRPYRSRMESSVALEELERYKDTQFDSKLIEAFSTMIRNLEKEKG